MQLKSVKPQTPALFQMLISLRLLSRSLPGVETLVCVGVFSFFSFCLASFLPLFLSSPTFSTCLPPISNAAPRVYLDLTRCRQARNLVALDVLSLSHSFVRFCFFSSSSSPPSSSQLRANTGFFFLSSFRGVPSGLKQPHPESRCT